jgi:branched-chain amino acid aminotransferase
VRDWVPDEPGSLYLRPTLIGTEPALGVAPSSSHMYFVLASPVSSFFPNGFSPISVLVEQKHVRSACGGVGGVKTGGNYAAGLVAQERALAAGYDQVLFLDARERQYIEEMNAMGVFIVEDGVLVTPPLGDTILPSITRRSILEMLGDLGYRSEERPIRVLDLFGDIESGRVTEVFAVGTAAIITPIGALGLGEDPARKLEVGSGQPGPVTVELFEALTGMQFGKVPEDRGWTKVVERR